MSARTAAVGTLLRPRSVAFIGASRDEEKLSGWPLRNLVQAGFNGDVYAVGRGGGRLHGAPVLASPAELPHPIDVAFVTLPAAASEEAVAELLEVGVGIIVIAANGFAETGSEDDRDRQARLVERVRAAGAHLLGPNTNGVYNYVDGIPLGYNYVHARPQAPGSVGLVSHSGALVSTIAPMVAKQGSGISHFVSCGNEADLDLLDAVAFLVDDADTGVIGVLLDSVAEPGRFRELVRAAQAAGKEVVALKLGASDRGEAAATAHASRMGGAHAAYESLFADEGVWQAQTPESFTLLATMVAEGRAPRRPSVTAASTSGAGAVSVADWCDELGVGLASLSPATAEAMRRPGSRAQAMNPFDLGAGRVQESEAYLRTLAAAEETGLLLVVLTRLQSVDRRAFVVDAVASAARAEPDLPVLVVGGGDMEPDEEEALRAAAVPVGTTADVVLAARSAIHRLRGLPVGCDVNVAAVARWSVPAPGESSVGAVGASSGEPSEHETEVAIASPPVAWSEAESLATLKAAGCSVTARVVPPDADLVAGEADRVGYPLVLKGSMPGVAHKSDHGLVVKGLDDADEVRQALSTVSARAARLRGGTLDGIVLAPMVRDAVELVVAARRDPDFGVTLLWGWGGTMTELLRDVVVEPCPLGEGAITRLVGGTRVGSLLTGFRGAAAADLAALAREAATLTKLLEGRDDIDAVEVNPLFVRPAGEGVVVADALVVPRS
ncbi:hypothetical protein ER308_15245 [Egibacter rhizosphaerae]|uniref:CoA-binding domain-containing protein n=1 Tax=Egibacter rhizosphaerae TaxID=1670831 RepID=A0A411YI49_9ACTN|nr:acetate--CoA ligase family protein [Egibacter rhizosphaerae]QBI20786.1 hypothetical protein ER308_15245 [Egibacter rhizosphaerae]